MSALDDYDGLLRFYQPDDLVIVGSRAALVGLRDAINRALATGRADCLGAMTDGEVRAVIVQHVEPLVSRHPLLGAPGPIQRPPQRQEEPIPRGLVGVDRGLW